MRSAPYSKDLSLSLVSRAYLRERLTEAINNERYEEAADIRDELAWRDYTGQEPAECVRFGQRGVSY